MKAVARVGDICSGHDGFPSRPALTGSPNVFINNIPVHRVSDVWDTHCDSNSCHDSVLITGAPRVFINKLPVGRIGDAIACGSTILTGSPNVFIGD